MESLIFEDSPLGLYLEGQGHHSLSRRSSSVSSFNSHRIPSSPADSLQSTNSRTSSFAPRGRPALRAGFRSKLPPPLRLNTSRNATVDTIHNTCSKALNSRLGRADNAKFLERFRYVIVASQLLSELSWQGHVNQLYQEWADSGHPELGALTLQGVGLTASLAFACVYLVHWARSGKNAHTTTSRVALVLTIFSGIATVAYSYMRRHWLQYLRQQTIFETSCFVGRAQSLNAVIGASITLIQEVELVSRGYRLSTPLPPISRLEDRLQNRRCSRLRKAIRLQLSILLPLYHQACVILKPLAETIDLDKYFDIYDISASDIIEASTGYSDDEFEDMDSLKVLKLLVIRFHTSRKILLCCLLALDADGGKPDFNRWGAALEQISALAEVSASAEAYLRRVLGEEEMQAVPATPKIPVAPGREKWRGQLRKINNLSSGIRGLQAKMHVLREESDKTLDELEDISELGPNLVTQYDAIGDDLKVLMQEWEDGKVALANTLERNEKRLSTLSTASTAVSFSPSPSVNCLKSVDEGSPLDALKILNGQGGEHSFRHRSSHEFSGSDVEEVFEAVALPRQRPKSTFSREERIAKMREDREKRESLRDSRMANTSMLRELESVINLRPSARRTSVVPRITSV